MMRKLIIALNIINPLIAVALCFQGHWIAAVGVLFIAHALLLIGTLVPNCAWLGPLVSSFSTTQKEVWLTIDDGPDPQDTPFILDLLDRHKARATFFVIGEKAAKHPELIREILTRGHTIGNHTQTHPATTFWCIGPRRTRLEIEQCQATLKNKTSLFRAPAGMRNIFVHPVLRRHNLRLVGWSARGFDGRETDPAKIIARIKKNLRPGAIILVHESVPVTREVMPELLHQLNREGFICVANPL